MSAIFSLKRQGRYALIVSFVLFCGICFYANMLLCAEKYVIDQTFYFLVSDSTHIEASAYTAQSQGGAGYLLSQGKKDYVAYAVYFSNENAQRGQNALSDIGTSSSVIKKSVKTAYFTSKKEKKKQMLYKNAFSCLYGELQALNGEIVRLENGATQRSSKEILQRTARRFRVSEGEYKWYIKYANVCKNAAEKLEKITEKTIFVSDLRYLLCSLSDSYINLIANFSL